MSRDAWVAPQIQRLFEAGSLCGLTEWQLLERFARQGDQAAFELLVSRYGPMVFGVCRRILRDAHDVDDAFQATFLVLIRRARSLGPGDVLAAWLHGVALKVARRARSRRDRLLRCERTSVELEAQAPAPRNADRDLRAVLDQEIDRLPWKYRAPVALCYLQGLTHEEAASRLGWPLGTVKGRLSRARTLLGSRLSRRGITSAAGAVAGSLAVDSALQAAPPDPIVAAALRASIRIADGRPWDAVVSSSIAELVRGVFTAMMFNKLKFAAALLMMSGVAATGAGVYGRQQAEGKPPEDAEPPPAVEAADAPAKEPPPIANRPVEGELIGGFQKSLHSPDLAPRPGEGGGPKDDPQELRRQLIDASERAMRTTFEEYREKPIQPDRVYRASRLLLDARLDAATTPAERTAAYQAHYERMLAVNRLQVPQRDGNIKASTTENEVRAFTAEARLLLAKSRVEPAASSHSGDDAGGVGPEASPRTLAILSKLEEPLAMNFPNEQPLEDVLKYIKQATQSPHDNGIPIYVDPIGLSEAEKTLTSPVSIDLDGVPLRRTLQMMLKQIGLAYYVDDGILVITSADSAANDSTLGPSMAKSSPLLERQTKAERGELSPDEMSALIAELKSINQMKKLAEEKDSVYDGVGLPRTASMTPEQVDEVIKQLKDLTAALNATQGKKGQNVP